MARQRPPGGKRLELAGEHAQWDTDYLNRAGTAKSNLYDNRPQETKYIYTDNDSASQQLNGQNPMRSPLARAKPHQ
jgi:hypothetical protein